MVFQSLKYLGALYLLWLTYRSAKAALMPIRQLTPHDLSGQKLSHSIARGALVHLTNPKVLFYWTSVFAVAIKPNAPPTAIFGVIIASLAMNVVVVSTWALIFSRPRVMAAYAKTRRWIEGISSALFGTAAIYVITSRS